MEWAKEMKNKTMAYCMTVDYFEEGHQCKKTTTKYNTRAKGGCSRGRGKIPLKDIQNLVHA